MRAAAIAHFFLRKFAKNELLLYLCEMSTTVILYIVIRALQELIANSNIFVKNGLHFAHNLEHF